MKVEPPPWIGNKWTFSISPSCFRSKEPGWFKGQGSKHQTEKEQKKKTKGKKKTHSHFRLQQMKGTKRRNRPQSSSSVTFLFKHFPHMNHHHLQCLFLLQAALFSPSHLQLTSLFSSSNSLFVLSVEKGFLSEAPAAFILWSISTKSSLLDILYSPYHCTLSISVEFPFTLDVQ